MMRYQKFEIINFKGIKHATVDLTSLTGANVFPFVGLNESGKTTLLEAIHSFSPDLRASRVTKISSGSDKDRASGRVPRHLLASFTGDTVVRATVSIDPDDRKFIADYMLRENDLIIDKSSIPDIVTMSRIDRFDRGDYVQTLRGTGFSALIKQKGQRNFKKAVGQDILLVWNAIYERTPDIAYYPTLIFDFPERIYVTPRPGSVDTFYKSVLEDILAIDGQGYTLDDLIRRVRSDKFLVSWTDFFASWMHGEDRGKVQQIIDRASSTVTKHVFGKWNKIFGEETKGKELALEYGVEAGRKLSDDKKSWISDDKHDIYVWFEIKDGTRRFKVSDRSLGFRWFFAFLLFTQFRVSRNTGRDVLFLFDEPAANLHAAAQQKLIESFPEIAGGNNMMIYTTHSHYMIEPAWLEQTFVVTNRSDSPKGSIVGGATLDDESLDIKAHRYRKFVNDNPNETSYFQPIVDRLEVVPSKFDYNLPSIVVEGKSDFYILEYARRLLSLGPARFIPGTGSGTFSALIALSVGWGIKFLFLLDSDETGINERKRYVSDLGASAESLVGVSDFIEGGKAIESLIDKDAMSKIQEKLGINSKVSKKQVQQFFQEQLAKNEIVALSDAFVERASNLLTGLNARLNAL